ncbi:MAG: cytochrome C oxidase subunit IV family protein [Planctomycetota bacterium]|nr:cytochrome C oxidase subunit IV family protein [Planctomycetota bacterium]
MTSTTLDTPHDETKPVMGHVVPPATLLLTFAALIVLTIVTVLTSTFGLGNWEIWVSLGIATVKGTLVAMVFMHLRYDNPFHALLAVFCLCFVMLFLGLTILDSQGYQADIEAFVERP